jgi:hypothetical protein
LTNGESTYLDDAFHDDEPTMNGIRVRKALPVTSFFIGSQLGDIGLCTDNRVSYYDNPKTAALLDPGRSDRGRNVFVRVDRETGEVPYASLVPLMHAATDPEGRVAPRSSESPRTVPSPNDYPFPVNELQTTGESLILFR